MKTTREIHFVKGLNLDNGVSFEGEITGDMLNRMNILGHFLILDTKFIREESLIHG